MAFGMRSRSATIVVAVAVLAACGGGNEELSSGVPDGAVAERALSGPGTSIGNGFEVVEGSWLIGVPVPLGTTMSPDDEPGVDEGWTAHLYVDGDPASVTSAFLAQAEGHGLEPAPLPQGEVFASEGEAVPPTGYATCGTTGRGAFECSASASDDGRCLTVDLVRDESSSHLRLRLTLDDADEACSGVAGVASNPDVGPPDPPEDWPARPETGDPFGARWAALQDVVVLEGSQVVAAPVPGADCGTTAVLRVQGDPVTVLDGYLTEFQRVSHADALVASDRVDHAGVVLERRQVNETAGGHLLTAALVSRDADEGAWLYVTGCRG